MPFRWTQKLEEDLRRVHCAATREGVWFAEGVRDANAGLEQPQLKLTLARGR